MLDLFGTDHAPPPKTKEQDYKDYLASAAWKLKRKQALHRAGEKCEVCGMSKYSAKLEVHHKTYERFKHERLDDLQVVCETCHDEQDKKRRGTVQLHNAMALEDAQFEGWCAKVYGPRFKNHWPHLENRQYAFDKWLERKGHS